MRQRLGCRVVLVLRFMPVASFVTIGATACGVGNAEEVVRSLFEQPVLSPVIRSQLLTAETLDTIIIPESRSIEIVGAEDGEDAYLFQEIVGLEVDEVSRDMYVVDRGRRQILVYSMDDGAFRRRIGRLGQGPGEFQEPADIFLKGDTVVGVWDPALRRVSLFDRAGTVLITRDLPPDGMSRPTVLRLGRLAKRLQPVGDGYLVEMRSDPLSVSASQQTISLLRLDEELTVRDTLLLFRAPPIVGSYAAEGGGQVTRYDAPPVFSPEGSWVVRPDGLVALAPGGAYQIVLTSPEFEQAALFERPMPREKVSRADRIRRLEHEASKPANGIPRSFPIGLLERMLRGKFSPYRPAITGLLWDGPNRLWVRRFDSAFDPEGPGDLWDIITWDTTLFVDARIVSVLRFGDGITPLRTTHDRIYGVQRDSLGVQRVVILPHPVRGTWQ